MTLAARSIRALLALLLAAGLLGVMAPASSAADWAPREFAFVEKINEERAEAGLDPVRANTMLTGVARDWTDEMVADDHLHHRPDLATAVTGSWSRLAENVGYSRRTGATEEQLVERLHNAFMNSPGHRRNVVGDFNQVGVGVRVASNGTMWVTVNFMLGPIDSSLMQDGPPAEGFAAFTDIGGTVHADAIEANYEAGIMHSLSRTRFGTREAVTREEMAAFLARAGDLPDSSEVSFPDVPASHEFASEIGAVAEAGIANGAASGNFLPADQVTRAEMASFLVRALPDLEPIEGEYGFDDVGTGNGHAASIAAIADVGITKGCSADNYCPNRSVTRAEMASFLARAYGL